MTDNPSFDSKHNMVCFAERGMLFLMRRVLNRLGSRERLRFDDAVLAQAVSFYIQLEPGWQLNPQVSRDWLLWKRAPENALAFETVERFGELVIHHYERRRRLRRNTAIAIGSIVLLVAATYFGVTQLGVSM